MPTAADILIDTLIDWQVKVIFGLPGDGINGIMEALRTRQDQIGFVQVRHEESAAFMACAYAKWTGELASASPRPARAGRICSPASTTPSSTRPRCSRSPGCNSMT